MRVRYFKATDGRFVVFRATASRVYGSAWIQSYADGKRPTVWGFSMKPPGVYPLVAEEISQAEYQLLNGRKIARIQGAGGNPKWAAPHDSWVHA